MSAPTKAQMVKAAYEQGQERALTWLQSEVATIRSKTFAEWRAMRYADAVMEYEHGPHFMKRLKAWEQGFDAAAGGQAAATSNDAVLHAASEQAAGSAAQPVERHGRPLFGPGQNPKFMNVNRAAYELGHLLIELPDDFGSAKTVSEEQIQIAAAVERHANSACRSILSGIEAIGRLMETRGDSDRETLEPHTVHCLGDLLRHLAVEAQFMQEIGGNLAFSINDYQQRQAVRAQGGAA